MTDTVYVVDTGLDLLVDLLVASTYKYVTWGTYASPAATSDTQTTVVESSPYTTTAATGTQSQQTTGGTTGDTYRVVATLTADGSTAASITEVAIINQATVSGATLFLHGTFTGIGVSNGDSITFTINVLFNQA